MNPNTDYSILVHVEPTYLPERSQPEQQQFAFAYTVTLENTGKIAAKLLTRHWIITNSDGKVQEVHGEGVVGVQPDLKPGEVFSYTSGTVLTTPVGTMQGSYQMHADDGHHFDAAITPFLLAVPGLLH